MPEEIEERPLEEQQKTANEEKASELNFVYASAVETFGNLWDLRIVFGDRKPNGGIDRRVAVVMSHRHAKALTQILANQIKRLEKAYGDIGTTGVEIEVDDEITEDARPGKAKVHSAGG